MDIGEALRSGKAVHLNGRKVIEVNVGLRWDNNNTYDSSLMLCWVDTMRPVAYTDLKSNSWEVEKFHEKIVIINVKWKIINPAGIVCPIGINFHNGYNVNWETFLSKPKMKMTLEWDE